MEVIMNLINRNQGPLDVWDLFDEMLSPASGRRGSSSNWFNPTCDVEETESHYLMSFDLPGMKKDEVKIELVDNQLVVSGERKEEHREDKKSWRFTERRYGKFQRVFTLPSAVDSSKIEADYQEGVLKIAVPKAETAKPKQIRIGEGKTGFFSKLVEGHKVA
jgi:HSP20 family protein